MQTDEETVRRLTERMGTCMEVAQMAEDDIPLPKESKEKLPLQRCVFSADGGYGFSGQETMGGDAHGRHW